MKNLRRVKILFLGQCLNYGYSGVTRTDTYPNIAEALLRLQFPAVAFRFDYKYFHHPRGLRALLSHRLLFSKPDIAVINIPAMFAARSWRVNLVYQMAPEVVDTARSLLMRIRDGSLRDGNVRPDTLLDRTSALHPPISLPEYETILEEAIGYCGRTGDCRLVLMGPGRFNVDTIENYAIHSPELWSSVNEMVERLGDRWNLSFINAQETLSEYGGEVFIPENHRWSILGHRVVAREVQRVLASELTNISA